MLALPLPHIKFLIANYNEYRCNRCKGVEIDPNGHQIQDSLYKLVLFNTNLEFHSLQGVGFL